MPSARRNQGANRGKKKKSNAPPPAKKKAAKGRGGGGIRKKRKDASSSDASSSDDDDAMGKRDDEDAYEDLPSDFSDEEIDEDEAFDDEDREMYRGMTFYDSKKKKSAKDGVDGEEEDSDDDGFGELIARAQNEGMNASNGNDDDHNDKAKEEQLDVLADSDDDEEKEDPKKKIKKKTKKDESKTIKTTALPNTKMNIKGVNDALDDEEQIELDSEDDDETRQLDDDEKDDKRKKMLDDILGENRRERRLEQPKPGSVTEYEKEGMYNAPVEIGGETLTLDDAIAALTRAKRSTGEIVDEDDDVNDDDDDDDKPIKDGDLNGASLRALRRISKKDATPQPARKSVTEKMTRVAAYETTKEDLGKWQPIVQENRKKETLTFEPSSKKMINRKDTLGALKDDFEPRTKMEKEIASILKDQADAFDEEQIAKAEELALSKMDPEEAKARRARLAKMKALMFYHERKAARLKKIKSKDYHRREKRANKMKAKKNGELMGDGNDEDDLGLTMDDDDFDENGLDSEGRTAEERREYFRVRERVLLKHRNTSRWAKRAIKKGIAHLPGTREAMAEQHRLAQQLKQKVNAPGDDSSDEDGANRDSESEFESGSEEEEEDPEQRRKRAKQKALDALYQANGGDEDLPEGLSKGVFALPFMKRAQEKKKLETTEAAKAILEEMQREDDGDGSDDGSDDDLNIVDEKDAKEWQAIAEKARAATTKEKSRVNKQFEQQQKQAEKKNNATSTRAKTVPLSKAARIIRERAALRNRPPARFEKFEPVLMEDDEEEKKRKAAAMKKVELYVEPRHLAEKAEKEKQKKVAIANGTYVEEEEGEKDDVKNFNATATGELDDQKSLVSRAFAGDDVEEAFQKEKLKDIEEELPDVERPTLLPGWGAWEGERKSTPKWIIDQNKKADTIREKALKSRKDAKMKRVIISERYDKKAAAYNVEKLPRGYDSKAVYEGSMRTPLGADVNTEKQFRKLTKPKILKPSGAIIAPIKFPRNAKPPASEEQSAKKKRRTN